MDIRMNPVSYEIAKAWANISSESPVELFDDFGNNMGVTNARFTDHESCIINDMDYVMYPKVDKDGNFILTSSRKVIIFLVAVNW